MSRSLSRIRNLISEIEEIQRQGQQGNKTLKERVPAPSPEVYSAPAPLKSAAPEFVIPLTHAAKIDRLLTPPADPFEALDEVVNLDSKRINAPALSTASKVFVQLKGQVALTLKIEDSNETVELKQVGDVIEIRFSDGKAFHIPLKGVA